MYSPPDASQPGVGWITRDTDNLSLNQHPKHLLKVSSTIQASPIPQRQ